MNSIVLTGVGMGNNTTPTNVVYGNLFLAGILRDRLRINFETPVSKANEKLEAMRYWEEGWNGHDVSAPNPAAIDYARKWLRVTYESLLETSKSDKTKAWREPHITASADGDVLFEWWNGNRGLSIYVSETAVSYIKDWGVNIQDEMEDGILSTLEQVVGLWTWMLEPPTGKTEG